MQVFSLADRYHRDLRGVGFYRLDILGPDADAPIRTDTGFSFSATGSSDEEPVDTLVVIAGPEAPLPRADVQFLRTLRRLLSKADRIVAVGGGASLLQHVGFVRESQLEQGSIFEEHAGLFTCAGGTSTIDLSLVLVEQDLGASIVYRIARTLMLPFRRSGTQSQRSALLELQASDRHAIRDLQSWIVDHLAEDLSVKALARRTAMSERNLTRVFTAAIGMSPARFVERIRIEAVRRRLEESDTKLQRIAEECGFRSDDSMRRAFVRVLRRTPKSFRAERRTLRTTLRYQFEGNDPAQLERRT